MLVLSRKLGQSIRLPDVDVTVRVTSVSGSTVRLAIDAPELIRVVRDDARRTEARRTPAAAGPVD